MEGNGRRIRKNNEREWKRRSERTDKRRNERIERKRRGEGSIYEINEKHNLFRVLEE